MQPQQYYSNPTNSRAASLRRWLVFALILILLAWGGVFIYRQVVFRVSKTNPNMNHVASATAFIKIHFNKSIKSEGLSLSYSSPIVEKYTLGDKEIDLTLKDGALTVGKHYTITINSVTSTGGKEIKNKKLSFTVQNLPANKISEAQKKALISRQDNYPYKAQYINYLGFGVLLDNGLSTNQLTALKEDLYGYSNQVNQKFWTINLVPSSLSVQIHNAESESLEDNYSFDVTMANVTYHAHAVVDPIDDQLQLQLFDANNNLVYDSINGSD
jgi:hypothetical protein